MQLGSITRQGPPLVRWASIEAVADNMCPERPTCPRKEHWLERMDRADTFDTVVGSGGWKLPILASGAS